ncbi:hypothetical protein NKH77_01620 [Streptomyces sp. M19]
MEGHGTGTRLGDPIEAQALIAAYGRGGTRTGRCGWARSSRTSGTRRPPPGSPGSSRWSWRCATGRSQDPAPGHAVAPRGLGRRDRTAAGRGGGVAAGADGRRRCGVSSFGISGTNAHVIVEAAPTESGRRFRPDLTRCPDRDRERDRERTGGRPDDAARGVGVPAVRRRHRRTARTGPPPRLVPPGPDRRPGRRAG